MTEQFRYVIALVISTVVLFCWQYFFVEQIQIEQNFHNAEQATIDEVQSEHSYQHSVENRVELIQNGMKQLSRVRLANEYVEASINLQGAKLDDLVLTKYSQEAGSQEKFALLSPKKTEKSYLAEFGWLNAKGANIELPTHLTFWTVKNSSRNMLNLEWINSQNVKFNVVFRLDDRYMFNVTQTVENLSNSNIELHNYASISRYEDKVENSNSMIHEGAIGVFDNKLTEISYEDLRSENSKIKQSQGWIGFSDKYWLVSLIPDNADVFDAKFSYAKSGAGAYQADLIYNKVIVEQGGLYSAKLLLFAGAKEIQFLHDYQAAYNISLFDRAVDFGILYFITKPIFLLLNYFYQLLGNFGYAILLLTVVIKILLFPLAYKGFASMNKLKALQPQLLAIKEQYGSDVAAFQKAMIALYKSEKVNPMSGCLPIVMQMPIFIALYKVLSVTIEMRQAPFLGWIQDLSLPDPMTVFNLFGVLPFELPSFLMIGILPILMAITMYIQQNLNPAPTDQSQAMVMRYLPLVFLFLFASFPSGLVLYWTWSNILSIVQQLTIKKITS